MKTIHQISKLFWISTLLLLIICPVSGQNQRAEVVSPEDYHLWSTLQNSQISDNGQWISYTLTYESSRDTLFLKQVQSKKTIAISKGKDSHFLGDVAFGCIAPDNRFELVNLKNTASHSYSNVSKFIPLSSGILLEKIAINNQFELQLLNNEGEILKTISNVTYYAVDPIASKIAFLTTNTLVLYDCVTKNSKSILKSNPDCSPIIKWQDNGTSFVFADAASIKTKNNYNSLSFYKIKNDQLLTFDTQNNSVFPKGFQIDSRFLNFIHISTDEQAVYFTIGKDKKQENRSNDQTVQIWNVADKDLYPMRALLDQNKIENRLVKWSIKNNSICIIGAHDHPQYLGHIDQAEILLYNEEDNKPHFTQYPDKTLWIYDTKTNQKKPFLEKLEGGEESFSFSPKGNYFLYLKEMNWWLYNFKTKTHTNFTKDYNDQLYNFHDPRGQSNSLYSFAGWSKNEKALYLYDAFDIWEFNPETFKATRLTYGKEIKKTYRLLNDEKFIQKNQLAKADKVFPSGNLMLYARDSDNNRSGFSYLDRQKKVHEIIFEEKLTQRFQKAKNTNTYLYSSEDYDTPPTLCIVNNRSSTTITHTNSQYKKYAWGHSELITYTNSKGNVLSGVLLFPANYDPSLHYPLLVNIYEKQTYLVHQFSNPSYLNGPTLNCTNFTNAGYFVLLPDIEYALGDPGISAVDCVTAAVHKVVKNYPITEKKIGLIGQSFGGYETAFIVSQTNLFATAVAGAAVTDLTSNYLDHHTLFPEPNAWRYEHYQMRMEKGLFEDYQAYQRNSTIPNATKIATPLLIYTGGQDTQVNPTQSLELYLALQRLQKKSILLVYPKESHVFFDADSQKDLSLKLMDWFNYYLKDKPMSSWMQPQ